MIGKTPGNTQVEMIYIYIYICVYIHLSFIIYLCIQTYINFQNALENLSPPYQTYGPNYV